MHYVELLRSVFTSLGHFLDIKIAGAALMGAVAFLFGLDHTTAMLSLIALMVFDLITGTIAATFPGQEGISSRRAAKTPLKFGVYLLLVSAAHLADASVYTGIFLQETMIAFLALTELISILENAGKMGIAVPKQLTEKLTKLRDSK